MEMLLKEMALHVALAAELVCVICIALGALQALYRGAVYLAHQKTMDHRMRGQVWLGFALWIMLALEFALAADIVRTAIAPTWDDIGQLAAIAVIRTALNVFLERDVEAIRKEAEPEARMDAA